MIKGLLERMGIRRLDPPPRPNGVCCPVSESERRFDRVARETERFIRRVDSETEKIRSEANWERVLGTER
jgi:hypothetical protein